MSANPAAATFLDSGVEWNNPTRFSATEREALLNWYRQNHGDGSLDLVQFAPFLMDHLPEAFKLSRRHNVEIHQPRSGVGIPGIVTVLCYLHTYAVIANGKGILYEIMGARHLGASKQLVLDVLGYAYLSAGPMGMNAVAEVATAYLESWTDQPTEPVRWPEGWAPDAGAFSSGIDPDTAALGTAEIDSISAWHERMHGSVPKHIALFARLHPAAYKVHRLRYERSIGQVMPAQLAPLMTLHLATLRMEGAVMRSALHHARVLGVRRHHAVQSLLSALRQRVDPLSMELAAEAVGDILAEWPE